MYILKNSPIYKLYKKNNFKILSKEEYIETVIYALDNIDKKTVVHRITGDPPKKNLYKPKWCSDKLSVISEIDKNLKELNKSIVNESEVKKNFKLLEEKG